MRLSGFYTLDAPRPLVWPRIFDPTSLMALIPGCQSLDRVSEDEYRGRLMVWLSAVTGTYETYVKVVERIEPDRCAFKGEVIGPTGVVTGTAAFTLTEVEDRTVLAYQAEGVVTGALGKLNARFLEGVAQTLIRQGLAALNDELLAVQARPDSQETPMPEAQPLYHYVYYPF